MRAVASLLEPQERAEMLERRTRRAEAVGRVIAIAVTDRHAAEQHLLGRKLQEFADDPVHARPGFLRAGVEPIAASKVHERVNVAAEIGPLARPKLALDGDEEP